MRVLFYGRLRGLILPLSLLVLGTGNHAFGQKAIAAGDDAIPPPELEAFVEATDLIVPWRSTGCHSSIEGEDDPDCYNVKAVESMNSHRLSLFNSDGSLWWRFSVSAKEPDYFLNNTKIGFIPFSTSAEEWPSDVVLRLSGESPSWYEVEVNENTRATKYVLKKDPMWAKVTWYYWFVNDSRIYIDNERTKLHVKPNGNIVEDTANDHPTALNIMKLDGDWALVRGFRAMKMYKGWIRWRQGRKILIGCIFNHFKVP